MIFFFTQSTKHLRGPLEKQGVDIGQVDSFAFADGERGYRLKESVKRRSVAIIASVLPDPESLFELMALYRLSVENGARKTTLVVPYLGYARQDRPSHAGEGSMGIMVLEVLQRMNPSQLILLDVH